MSDEEAKAVQAVAKAVEKSLDSADKVGSFFSRVFGQPIEDTVGVYWGDKIRAKRIERAIDLTVKVQKKLQDAGVVDIRSITEKVGIPLIENATLEDDPDIKEMWVNLLASALDPNTQEIKKKHVTVLSEISGGEARLLKFLFDHKLTEDFYPGCQKASLGVKEYRDFKIEDLKLHTQADEDNIRSLLRLGVLKPIFFESVSDFDCSNALNELSDKKRTQTESPHLHVYTDVEKTTFTEFGRELMSRVTGNDAVKKDK